MNMLDISTMNNSNTYDELMYRLQWKEYCSTRRGGDKSQRDFLTRLFFPENQHLHRLISKIAADKIIQILLGTKKYCMLENNKEAFKDTLSLENALTNKYNDKVQKLCLYDKIIRFCQIIGVSNIYDIGCEAINQSFLFVPYTNMTYTGMDVLFMFNDWWGERHSNNILNVPSKPYCEEAPPPFCDGRISFVKGYYPQVSLDIAENSIAVACYSLTMYRERGEIIKIAAALNRDFERVIFNLPFTDFMKEILGCWKESDLREYMIYPIGSCGFLYATKYPEDIKRLKKAYPYDEQGYFDTGIDNHTDHLDGYLSPVPFEYYLQW